MDNQQYYLNNAEFTIAAEKQDPNVFRKYTDTISHYLGKEGRFLDVGCGTGIAIMQLREERIKSTGVEISEPSIKVCKKKGLDCKLYDGSRLPFENSFFDAVGSYNVLEHTDKPEVFLEEQLRALKPGGYLIIGCPNFLSITNNFHWHTKGTLQKLKNIYGILTRLIRNKRKTYIEKMPVIIRKPPQPDDSACNVTNPIDLYKWARNNNLKLKYWSSMSVYRPGAIGFLDFSFLKLFFGASLMVFKKEDQQNYTYVQT